MMSLVFFQGHKAKIKTPWLREHKKKEEGCHAPLTLNINGVSANSFGGGGVISIAGKNGRRKLTVDGSYMHPTFPPMHMYGTGSEYLSCGRMCSRTALESSQYI